MAVTLRAKWIDNCELSTNCSTIADATYYGNAKIITENGQKVLSLDGTTGTYVKLPSISSTVDFESGFTIETKQKWTSFDGYYARIFDASPGNGAVGNVGLAHVNTTSTLETMLGNSGTEQLGVRAQVENYFVLNMVQTTKVTLKKNSSSNYTLYTYKNDTLVSTYTYNFCPVVNSNKLYVQIGRSAWYGSTEHDGFFQGTIYYVKLTLANGTKVVDVNFNEA